MNNIKQLNDLGQSIWCDNISRGMLDSGELKRLIGLGVVGVTSNPTIFMKAITGTDHYDSRIANLLSEGRTGLDLYEGLVLEDIADAADQLREVYDRTDGVDGFVSLEVSPKLAWDTEATVVEARRLHGALKRPNVFIKVPATAEGVPAIERLIAEGISINVTLIFSIERYHEVMEAYISGLGRLASSGGDLSRVSSVASFFVSRVDSLVDKRLAEVGGESGELLGKAAVANARLAYEAFEQRFGERGGFGVLAGKGARVQRPLWASTSTKNPAYSPTKYVDELVAPDSVNTLPPATIEAVLEGGPRTVTIREDLPGARGVFARLESLGISMVEVTEQLSREGVDLFAASFDELLADLSEKESQVQAAR